MLTWLVLILIGNVLIVYLQKFPYTDVQHSVNGNQRLCINCLQLSNALESTVPILAVSINTTDRNAFK